MMDSVVLFGPYGFFSLLLLFRVVLKHISSFLVLSCTYPQWVHDANTLYDKIKRDFPITRKLVDPEKLRLKQIVSCSHKSIIRRFMVSFFVICFHLQFVSRFFATKSYNFL